jgi:hypothetical protein
MKWILGLTVALAFALAACSDDGGNDDDGGDNGGSDNVSTADEEAVAEAFQGAIDALSRADFDEFYSYFSDDFQERCEKEDFDRIMGIASVFLGDTLEDLSVTVDDVRFEGDRAYVTATFEGLGEGEAQGGGDITDFWVKEDGEWKADTDDDTPCDIEGGFNGDVDGGADEGDPDDGADAPSGPGTSRAEAVEIGTSVQTGDAEVAIVEANLDADAQILAQSDFADPPAAGNRYVLVTVSVSHVGSADGNESLDVSTSDFKLTGSGNVIYDGFDQDTSCGFIEGEISGEIFPGGELEGHVCFQVPESETDLILIAQPFFSFEDEDRRYLRLE